MTDAPKLLPCPFCGGTKLSVFPPNCKEDDEYDPKDNAQPVVRCYTCFAEILGKTWDHDMKSAVTAWNTRADLIPAMLEAARREALEEAAKACEADYLLEMRLCCNGHECGCHGSSVGEYIAYQLRALAASPQPKAIKRRALDTISLAISMSEIAMKTALPAVTTKKQTNLIIAARSYCADAMKAVQAEREAGEAELAASLAASPRTPTPVDGGNSGETVGKWGA